MSISDKKLKLIHLEIQELKNSTIRETRQKNSETASGTRQRVSLSELAGDCGVQEGKKSQQASEPAMQKQKGRHT